MIATSGSPLGSFGGVPEVFVRVVGLGEGIFEDICVSLLSVLAAGLLCISMRPVVSFCNCLSMQIS